MAYSNNQLTLIQSGTQSSTFNETNNDYVICSIYTNNDVIVRALYSNRSVNDSQAYQVCVMTEFVGNVEAEINGEYLQGSGWHNSCSYAGDGGFEIVILSDSKYWINPKTMSAAQHRPGMTPIENCLKIDR